MGGDGPGSTMAQKVAVWGAVACAIPEATQTAFPQNFYKEIDRQAMYIR